MSLHSPLPSVKWELEKNEEYARGYCYVGYFDWKTHADEFDRILRTVDNPCLRAQDFQNAHPIFDENISGSLCAVHSVPFVICIDEKKGHEVTILGVATPKRCFGYKIWAGSNGPHETLKHFVQVAWYSQEETQELDVLAFKPIWQYNLHSNTCSAKSHPKHSCDRLFNLASTHTKGNGDGIIRLAVQNSQPEVVGAQWMFNMLLRKIFIAIILGRFAGKAACTDPGPSLIARQGIYICETNTIVLFTVFKGNNLHGGRSSYTSQAMVVTWVKELSESLAAQGGMYIVSCLMFAVYPSNALNQYTASVPVTPQNTLGNGGPKSLSNKTALQDFAQHGCPIPIPGTDIDYHNRMGREIILSFYNSVVHLGFELPQINAFLSMLKFQRSNPNHSQLVPCMPMVDYNQSTKHGHRMFNEEIKHYVWMNYVTTKYYINISKKQYGEHLTHITTHKSGQAAAPLPLSLKRKCMDDSLDDRPNKRHQSGHDQNAMDVDSLGTQSHDTTIVKLPTSRLPKLWSDKILVFLEWNGNNKIKASHGKSPECWFTIDDPVVVSTEHDKFLAQAHKSKIQFKGFNSTTQSFHIVMSGAKVAVLHSKQQLAHYSDTVQAYEATLALADDGAAPLLENQLDVSQLTASLVTLQAEYAKSSQAGSAGILQMRHICCTSCLANLVWDHTFGDKSSSLVADLVGVKGHSVLRTGQRQSVICPEWPDTARLPAILTADILPDGSQNLDKSMLVLIVRESLALHSDPQPPLHPTVTVVFLGRNPFHGHSQNSAFHDCDHWDTLCHDDLNHKVFADCFEPTDLTQEDGTSCVMSFMSAGLGHETRNFAMAMPWRELCSLEDCISQYQPLKGLHRLAFNTYIFGQPSAVFKL
ncbi:hypothetical protein PENSPDRAFT_672302 [Peniophora sp. CONT]|nr:hypothetical protein PENSPDRAFT_672302 [Peniophora sp. CONT]